MARRALVTGGAGFIGSNLVDALLERGDEVAVIDNLRTGRIANLESATANGAVFFEADIRNPSATEFVFKWQPQVIFHLAAQIDVRRAVADPLFDAQQNIEGTIAMLEAARTAGATRFILSSTGGALYGEADVVPTPETAPLRPLAPYGVSKASAELYCELYSRLFGLSTACLRLANVYGPRQDPLGEGGVVAIFCNAARGDGSVTVFGDGKQTRDYVFVKDVAAAFIAAGDSDVNDSMNVSTGVQTSVLDLVERLGVVPRFEALRPGEVIRSCLDSSLAQKKLGWIAQTELAQGLIVS